LEDEEFDKLPYEGIGDSLGFADPETGDAFVRKTGVKDWDMATIQHEMDELLASGSFHTDADGIRHKKVFKEVLAPVLATVAGSMIGAPYLGALGAPLGAMAGSAIQQKTMTGKISPLQTGLAGAAGYLGGPGIKAGYASVPKAGILGKVGAGLKGMITGGPKAPLQGPVTAAQAAKGMTTLEGGISPAVKAFTETAAAASPYGKYGMPSAGVITHGAQTLPPAVSGVGAGMGSILGTTLAQLQKPVTTVGAPAAAPGVTPPTATPGITPPAAAPGVVAPAAPATGLGAIAKKLVTPQNLLGAGVLGAGAIPKTPEFQMPESVSRLEEAFLNQKGLSEVGQIARGELLKTLQARPEELYPVADDAFIEASLRGTRESYERAQEQLDASYNIAGVYGSGEHLAAKDKLREELAQLESDFMALEQNRRFTMAQETKRQAVVTALQDAGLTEQNIMEIASLDVQTAAMKYGAEVSDMQTIKEALAGIGSELLMGSFKPKTETTIQ
jgi:hypothetical protein